MRQLFYLNHSGFVLELERAVLVFDYFTDPASVLSRYEESAKSFFFFVSHAHYDHWNSDIFHFSPPGRRFFFLEEGCELPDFSFQEAREDERIYKVKPGFCEENEAMAEAGLRRVRAMGSTDEGVSFLIDTEDGIVFHSGDLNFWDWEAPGEVDKAMEAAYRTELERVAEAAGGKKLWLTMLPVDQRLGEKAFAGAMVFFEYFKTDYFVPDHLNGGFDLPGKLAGKVPEGAAEVLPMITPGQHYRLKKGSA